MGLLGRLFGGHSEEDEPPKVFDTTKFDPSGIHLEPVRLLGEDGTEFEPFRTDDVYFCNVCGYKQPVEHFPHNRK